VATVSSERGYFLGGVSNEAQTDSPVPSVSIEVSNHSPQLVGVLQQVSIELPVVSSESGIF